MSELVELVGQAIAKDQYWHPGTNVTMVGRAAIAAMRPSKEFIWNAVYNLRPMLNCIRGHDLTDDEAYRIFNAVIDAALSSGLYGAGGGGGGAAGPGPAAGGGGTGRGIIELHYIPKEGGSS